MQPLEQSHQVTVYDSGKTELASLLELDLGHNAVMYAIIDPHRYEIAISDKFVASVGFTRDEWAKNPAKLWVNRLHPDYKNNVLAQANKLSSATTPLAMESIYLFRPKIGAPRWIRDTVRFDRYTLMSRMEDITKYMRTKALNEASKFINQHLDLDTVLTKIQEILHTVLQYDRANIVLRENGDWRTKLKWTYENGILTLIKSDETFSLENKELVKRLVKAKSPAFVLDTSQPNTGYHATGDYPAGSWVGAPIYIGQNREVIGVLQLNSDMTDSYNGDDAVWLQSLTEHIALALENSRLMTHDGLTGLFMHNHLIQEGIKEVARAARYKGQLAVLMVDADYFKQLNDSHGHPVGDVFIWSHGQILRKLTRNIDVAGRWGGEEYALILPETGLEGAYYLAERIRLTAAYVLPKILERAIRNSSLEDVADLDEMINDAIKKSIVELQTELSSVMNFPPGTTFSIGVSTLTQYINTFNELIIQADKNAYSAKRQGRNQVYPIPVPKVVSGE